MVYRIGIIGPESTGKTTLAKELARKYNGIYVPEYAREYVEQKGTTEVTYEELCEIARQQIEQMKSLTGEAGLTAKRSVSETVCQAKPVFYDTELIITKVWFEYAFGRWPEWLDEAIKQYPMDLYILLYPDIPWVPDNARSNGSDAIRLELFERYKKEVEDLGIECWMIKHN
jgi:NadR type nicotinamide-nucleotide adenylyltransferase